MIIEKKVIKTKMNVDKKNLDENLLKTSENDINLIKNNEKTIENEKEEYNDISKIAKAKKRIKVSSSNKIEKKEDNKIQNNKNEEPDFKTNNFGILSDLKELNLDSSPINKIKDKDTPTPSGLQEYRFNLIKMMDDDSKRNYPPKSSFVNSSTINSSLNDNESSFSFFLKNHINNDKSPIKVETPINDNEKLTMPNKFFVNLNDNNNNLNLDSENSINQIHQGMNNLNFENHIFINDSNFNNINNYNNINNNNQEPYNNFYIDNNFGNPNINNGQFQQNNSFSHYMSKNNNQFDFLNNNNIMFNNFQNKNFFDYSNMYNNNYLINPNNPIINVNINTNPNIFGNNINDNNFQQFINLKNNLNPMNYQQIFNINPIQDHINNNNNISISSSNSINSQKKKTKIPLKMNFNSISLNDLIKNSDTICKDQTGCRLLQKKIDEQPEIASKILNVCFEKIIEIITDSFGNYLVQKLYDYMNEEKFLQLIALIKFDIYHICINSFGTRAIQKLIDYLNNDNLINNFINMIKPIVKGIIVDINGSHILLKLLDLKNKYVNKVIFDEIKENILSIAMHKHGCCVLQKCIEKINNEDKNKMIECLINNCEILISDQCGNYIIQYIISLKNEKINERIVLVLIKKLEEYSKQKFSSNVVEKILECCSNKICQKIIDVLKSNENIILSILFDKFGNYVLQKALQRADEPTQHLILGIMAPKLYKLKNYSFGSKLYSKLIITYSYLGGAILTKNDSNDENKIAFNNYYYPNNDNITNINYNNNHYNNIDMKLYYNPQVNNIN